MKWILVVVVILSAVAGDLLQSHEMKTAGAEESVWKTIWRRRPLILSIACMAVSFFAFLALVQREPLSFAVPASAGTFVIETILAKFVLHERIGARRAAGTACILAGIFLIAR